MPLELQPQFTTIEYILNKSASTPPIFLYVVDTCLDDSDLQALKDTLIVSLSLLPPTALIGLVTYGTMVRISMIYALTQIQIHEIGYSECPKSYVFRGTKEYTAKQIQDMLGLLAPSLRPQQPIGQPPQARSYGASTRFLLPLAQCEFQLTTTIEQLQKDP